MCIRILRSFSYHVPNMLTPRSLGLIIIGDEILSGKTEETNSRLVCSTAPFLGLKLRKISVVPDDIDVIAKEATEFMRKFDVVLTSGGIGSTHDDVTFEGLAKALEEKTFSHPELLRVVENFFGFDATLTPADPRIRLTQVPLSSELIYGIDHSTGRKSSYPVVKVKNVYALPGVPRLFKTSFDIIKDRLRDPRIQFHSRSLYATTDEPQLAAFLTTLAQKYDSKVTVGSYPVFKNSYYRVCIALDSLDESFLQAAYQEASEYLRNDLITYEPDPVGVAAEAVYRLTEDIDVVFGKCVSKALKIIEDAVNQFSSEQLVIGFNGGKDCTALLHLIYAVWSSRIARMPDDQFHVNREFPKLLYIRSRSVFPELEYFVQHTLHFYRLRSSFIHRPDTETSSKLRINTWTHEGLIVYDGDIKSSIARFVSDFPDVRAVFMGTRMSDPRAANLSPFCMTDPDWPQILRINPILDWTYADVWSFIRRLSLPYCSLYDVGYTSLGSMEDTHPNPHLRFVTESGRIGYHPAYTLVDPKAERSGRQRLGLITNTSNSVPINDKPD